MPRRGLEVAAAAQPMTPESGAPRVLAIVSLAGRLSGKARSLFEHCGFVLLSFDSAEEAVTRLRRDIKPEAVLVDLRAARLVTRPDALLELIGYSRCAPWDARPLPVVALTDKDVPARLAHACAEAGVPVVPPHRRYFKAINRLLLDRCGGDGRCCRAQDAASRG
jgi:hypothetical protein